MSAHQLMCARLKPRATYGHVRRLLDVARDRDFEAVRELVHVGDGDHLARLHAGDDLDSVAYAVADLELSSAEAVAIDHEHAGDAVAVLNRGGRQRHQLVDLAALDVHARVSP